MGKKIELLEDIQGAYNCIYKAGEVYEEYPPRQVIHENGNFTLVQGMGLYFTVEPHQYKIVEDE